MRDIGRFFGDLFLSDKEKAKKAAKEKKQQEIREMEEQGDRMQTWGQPEATIWRNEYLRFKEESGFKGDILSITKKQLQERVCEIEFQAEEDGHKIEGKFEGVTCRNGCCIKGVGSGERDCIREVEDIKRVGIKTNTIVTSFPEPVYDWKANLVIDSTQLSPEAAKKYVEERIKLISVRWMKEHTADVARFNVSIQAEKHRKEMEKREEEVSGRLREQARVAEENRKLMAARQELAAIFSKPPEQPPV